MSVPIYSPLKSRAGALSRDGYMKNAFVEQTGESKFDNFRRPGLLQYSTNTAGAGQGVTGYKNAAGEELLYQVVGGTIYLAGVLAPGADFTKLTVAGTFTMTAGALDHASLVRYGGYFWLIGTNFNETTHTRFGVFYSSDGATWTKLVDVASGTAGYPPSDLYRVCATSAGFVLLGAQDGACWTSTDGATWTQASSAAFGSITGTKRVRYVVEHTVASGGNGQLYAFLESLSGSPISDPLYTSANGGTTWTSTGASQAYESTGVRTLAGCCSFGGSLWVVGGYQPGGLGKRVYQSTDDGATFAQVGSSAFTPADANGGRVLLLPYAGFMYAWVQEGTNINKIYRSTTGATWTLVTTWNSANSGDPQVAAAGNGSANNDNFCNSVLAYNDTFYYWEAEYGNSANGNMRFWSLANGSSPGATSIGSVGTGLVDFSQNYARTRLLIKSQTKLFVLNTDTATLTQVTDGDYPDSTARGLVYLDGFWFVMDTDGNIYNSDEEDATAWNPVNYLAAQYEPDGGVALAKYNLYVVAFGEYTTEFFWNAGNASGSPLLPVQQGVMNVGCADGDTVGQIDSQVIWLAQSKSQGQSVGKGRFIAQLNGNSYQKISTADVDRILDQDDLLDVDATTFKVAGHSYYHLRLGTTNISLVYDLTSHLWYVWNRRRDSFTQANLGNVVIANGTATATMTSSWSDGDVGIITGFTGTYTALNGTYNFTVSSNTYKWPVSFSGTATSTQTTGTATGYLEDDLGIVCAANYRGRQLLQDKSNGDLYELDPDTYQDDSIYMDWFTRLQQIDSETNENKFVAWADLITGRVSGNALMRYSDDDCQNFTRYRSRSLSGERTRWHRLGRFRRRTFDFRVTDNVAVKAEYMDSK